MTTEAKPKTSEGPSANQAPNPPSAAEPQPKGAVTPRKGQPDPQVAPEPGGGTPVTPNQEGG